jgi:D-alanine-D-alanine ligase
LTGLENNNVTASQKVHLGIIFGGRSGEYEVSLMSARSVLSVLDPEKYAVPQIGITQDGHWLAGEDALEHLAAGDVSSLSRVMLLAEPNDPTLYACRQDPQGTILEPMAHLDVIFPVLHGTFGEDGTLQGLLELADIAYVGCGVLASSVGMDKALFKDVMRAYRIPVVESVVVTRSQINDHPDEVLKRAESLSNYPLFIKPANLGSSVGITKCHSRAEMEAGLLEAARYDRRVIVERGLQAREIEVSVLGNQDPQVSIPGEIIPNEEFYSYSAKYSGPGSDLLIPAPLKPETVTRIQELARRAYLAIDGAGMARADFLLEKNTEKVYLSEINTIPGFTQISMYPKLWEASGLSYSDLIDRLIELAIQRKGDRDQTDRSYQKEL